MSKIEVYRDSDKKIVTLDALATIIVSMLLLTQMAKIHTAIALVISLAIGGVLVTAFMTKVGYVIVTLIFSVLWGILAGGIAYGISSSDKIWGIVVGIIGFLASLGSHGMAKRFYDNVEDR